MPAGWGSQDQGGIWRSGCEQSINAKAEAARNTHPEPADESQARNDKQIRPGYVEMEPADVFTVSFSDIKAAVVSRLNYISHLQHRGSLFTGARAGPPDKRSTLWALCCTWGPDAM